MAQFIAINKDVEVDGGTTLAFVNSMRKGKDARLAIMEKHGIIPEIGKWYSQQAWLDAFKEIADTVGDMNLFLIGTAIIENAQFPPINNLEEGLRSIDVAYHMNHRLDGHVMFNPHNGSMIEGIGHYSVVSYDGKARKAVMCCDNPYPSKFDEGIISQIVQLFKPADSQHQEVKLDVTKERRTAGGDSCTYLISW